jgi:hypothetical protein
VLRVAGLQRGLLSQLKSFDRGGRPSMIGLELDGEFTTADVDQGAAAGPALVQLRVDADDLPNGPLRRIGPGPFGEPHPQRVAEMLFEGGVVGLRRRHLRLEQHPAIDTQPAPVEGLNLVCDRDMGVQIRIAGAAVAVSERGRHQPVNVDLPDPLRPAPGEQRLLLDETQRIGDGGSVRPLDRRHYGPLGDRPQRRDRLHRRERQVVAGDRLQVWSRILRDLGCELPGVHRVPAVLGTKELFRHLGPDPRPRRGRDLGIGGCADQRVQFSEPLRHRDPEGRRPIDHPERSAQPHHNIDGIQRDVGAVDVPRAGTGEWMQAVPEQVAHLLRGYRIASVHAVYALHPGADPDPW